MSRTFVLTVLAVATWAAALFGALFIAQLPGTWGGHSICGLWGCGPPLQALLGCHGAWFIMFAPAIGWLMLTPRISDAWRHRIGSALVVGALAAVAALVVYERFTWFTSVSETVRQYFWHRCGFRLATAVDLPIVQVLCVGVVLLCCGRRGEAPSAQVPYDLEDGESVGSRRDVPDF